MKHPDDTTALPQATQLDDFRNILQMLDKPELIEILSGLLMAEGGRGSNEISLLVLTKVAARIHKSGNIS